MKRISVIFLLAAAACSSQAAPKAPAPVPLTPTPGILSRTDPNVIEETDTYVIRRLPKSQYIKIDDRHIRLPIVKAPTEFFKEDDEYYYTSTPKFPKEETELKEELKRTSPEPVAGGPGKEAVLPASDFTDLAPPVAAERIRLEEVKGTNLPERGMWRASFTIDDVNGDKIPDIVAPPARVGDGNLHVWIGDGKGSFREWPLSYTENGQPQTRFSIDYGGVAVGDIDGDGKKDIASASHSGGLVALFGDGKGGFRIVRAGLPKREFSSQAVILLDANGDGKLDIVASRDMPGETTGGVDKQQVRVYLFRGLDQGFEFKKDGILGAFFSNSLSAWDYDGDGRKDVLTGSSQFGALTLLWKNKGDGTFEGVSFPEIETYAFHFSTSPGTFGKARAATFADSFYKGIVNPKKLTADGVSLYTVQDGKWTRHRLWRKGDPKGNVFALAMGDLDGDGLDDVVFGDDEQKRLRILFQQADGTFAELDTANEPSIKSPTQCARIADLDGDGRNDIVVSGTVSSSDPTNPGGWRVYLNKR